MTEIALAETGELVETNQYVELSRTGLTFNDDTPYEVWAAVGAKLQSAAGSVNWWLGDWLRFGEQAPYGERYTQAIEETRLEYQHLANCKWVAERFEFSARTENLSWKHYERVAARDDAERWLDQAEANRWSVREMQQAIGDAQKAEALEVPPPEGTYRCIAIDPPWPMQKIERDVRPKQGHVLDYPVMSLDEIEALPVPNLVDPDGCHIYLWVTHKFLPDGLRLLDAWGFRYQCLMTWVKNVGITPFSWMYDTEHVIFGRCGSLDLDQLGMRLSFEAPVTRHSAKPDVFYERVIAASPGPRLEMFARSPREGFVVWGNEVVADAS